MLKQASLSEVREEKIPRNRSHIVITMRFYPRFLRKELRDEFACDLAPERTLLNDFNKSSKSLGDHNRAFAEVGYLRRFNLSDKALERLRGYAELSATKDVYFVCICALGEMCHREMLLLMAKKLFGAKIAPVFNDYDEFMSRLEHL
jgi:hypothetical protein